MTIIPDTCSLFDAGWIPGSSRSWTRWVHSAQARSRAFPGAPFVQAGLLFGPMQLARRVRQCHQELFGGIQLVMVGDFFQLPPVSKLEVDGSGGNKRMLFESPEFKGPGVCKVFFWNQIKQCPSQTV